MMSTASAAMLATSTVLAEDLLPALRRRFENVSSHRLITLLAGFTAVGIALAVDDAQRADLRLQPACWWPAGRALYWRRATTPAAIASMLLGCGAAIVFMIKDGLDANTPIYVSLAVSLASLVVISLATRADAPASLDGARAPARAD